MTARSPVVMQKTALGWTAMMGDHAVGVVGRREFDSRRPACWIMSLPLTRYGTRMVQPEFCKSIAAAQRALLYRVADWFEAAGQDEIGRDIRASIDAGELERVG